MDNVIFNPAVLSYLPYGIGVILALVGLFIVRLVLRSAIRRKVSSISDGPMMSMMDIDRMRKKGLVSEEEYRSIRHALAGSELSRERRRQQAEKDRLLLAEIERDPEAAKLLLASEPEEAPARPAKPRTVPAPAPATGPTAATPHIHQPAAQAALRRVTQPVAPELQPQPGDPLAEAIPGDPLTHPVRPGARPATGAAPTQPRPAAPRPATPTPAPAPPRVAPQRPATAPTQASNPARPAAPQPPSAQHPAAPHPATAPGNSQMGELELLLKKGAITPEEYRRLKSMVK